MRKLDLLLNLALLISGCALCGAAADQARFPSNEDMRHFRAMSAPQLSPDGRHVLVEITDSTADGGRDHLWLVDRDSNSSRQLTFSPPGKKDDKDRGETLGRWMPNGDTFSWPTAANIPSSFGFPCRAAKRRHLT